MKFYDVLLVLMAAVSAGAYEARALSPGGVCGPHGVADASGKYCCPKDSCSGKCGGANCDKRPGGAKKCCTSQISKTCDFTKILKLPCRIKPKPADLCAHGIKATVGNPFDDCKVNVCCPKSCGKCHTGDTCPAGTRPECCAQTIAKGVRSGKIGGSDVDVSCRYKAPPCVLPPTELQDPCATNPCKNGARCGVAYEEAQGQCALQAVCDCAALGTAHFKYTGKVCEKRCGRGEQPCGHGQAGLVSDITYPDTVCCAAGARCREWILYRGGTASACFWPDFPKSCDPNPCKNGGTCATIVDGTDEKKVLRQCQCKEGYGGKFCEKKTKD